MSSHTIFQRMTSGTTLATIAALMSTALSTWGMIGVSRDALGLPLIGAVTLAGFLELSLIATARLLHDAIRAGRRATSERIATWVFSVVSGAFSAAHEFVGPDRTWQLDASSGLAAAVRMAAPLVACWLWERRLRGDRAAADGRRTRAQTRQDRYVLAVALAALSVRRATDGASGDGWRSAAVTRRAWRRLHRRHAAMLRRWPPSPELRAALAAALAAVGATDVLPTMTAPTATPALPWDDDGGIVEDAERLTVAVTVAAAASATWRDLAAAFEARGWAASERTCQRWLARARDSVAQEVEP